MIWARANAIPKCESSVPKRIKRTSWSILLPRITLMFNDNPNPISIMTQPIERAFLELESQISALLSVPSVSYFYRGQANAAWKTQSTLCRYFPELSIEQLATKEQEILEAFTQKYKGTLFKEESSDFRKQWYLLMQAQHLFEPTRFLDWTPDWIRALYFVLQDEAENEQDGALLYTNVHLNPLHDEDLDQVNPFTLDHIVMVRPINYMSDDFPSQLGSKRIFRQIGKFLVLPLALCKNSLEEIYQGSFGKLIIPQAAKKELRAALERRGITYESMYFPELTTDLNPRD